MMNRRREVIVNLPSSTPGMFGWIAVHVHANKVAKQLQTMSDADLVLLQDGQLLVSSVEVMVPLKFDGEA